MLTFVSLNMGSEYLSSICHCCSTPAACIPPTYGGTSRASPKSSDKQSISQITPSWQAWELKWWHALECPHHSLQIAYLARANGLRYRPASSHWLHSYRLCNTLCNFWCCNHLSDHIFCCCGPFDERFFGFSSIQWGFSKYLQQKAWDSAQPQQFMEQCIFANIACTRCSCLCSSCGALPPI